MVTELATLNDGRRVLGKRYKGEVCSKTFANLTQANRAADKLRAELLDDVVVKVVGHRPFYVMVQHWSDLFEACHEVFRNEIVALARTHGKTVQQVYLWWREYSAACSDQSALLWEFKRWYAEKLGPVIVWNAAQKGN